MFALGRRLCQYEQDSNGVDLWTANCAIDSKVLDNKTAKRPDGTQEDHVEASIWVRPAPGTTNITDTHAIYLCPFKEIMFGPTDDATVVNRLVSYDPAFAGKVALGTSTLGTNVLPLSGDLATADDRAPRVLRQVPWRNLLQSRGLLSGARDAEEGDPVATSR
ncbi:MAG: hypothetical protein V2A73_04905 [Pseudomonadota bacterium]